VLIQGLTGNQGSYHAKLMLKYGTKVVAGTSPGKGGTLVHSVPVYDSVIEAQSIHAASASVVFVPAPFVLDAVLEALEGGIKTVVVISEHVPVRDTVEFIAYAEQVDAVVVGPNSPGIIVPGKCKLGIMPEQIFNYGNVGLASRSGTLTYEVAAGLTRNGFGQSTCLGLGGDPVTGLNFIDALKLFRDDANTKAVVLVGEIGGNLEELAAKFIAKEYYPKPVVAYVAGLTAPQGKRMGHAGAIIMGNAGTANSKVEAFRAAGVEVAEKPSDVARLVAKVLFRE
jgi:succinyl-CoA synthetase alpha subunit